MTTHLVIPDAHASINVSNRRFDWLGEFILEEQPDVIIDIGDFGDLSTLGTYDVGTKNGEGKRILDEVACIKDASDRVFKRISAYNSTRTRHKKPQYNPRIIRCGGNHEEGRLKRFINENPRFEGLVTLEQMGFKDHGSEYVPFLQPTLVDGIAYSHFFYVKDKRYPISTAKMLLQKLHMSATCGHSHIRDFSEAARPDGKRIQGLIVGGYHDPENKDSDYAGPQGVLTWWSGVVMKYVNESGGTYSPRFIDIEELQKRYG